MTEQDLHTFPDARQIVVSVREFLTDEVAPATEGTLSFHARVAANLLRILERELASDSAGATRLAADLTRFGVEDERALAHAIRTRAIAGSDPRLRATLAAATLERLLVSNPRYLEYTADDDPRARRASPRED